MVEAAAVVGCSARAGTGANRRGNECVRFVRIFATTHERQKMATDFDDEDDANDERGEWESGGALRPLFVGDLPALKVDAFAALQRFCINFHKSRATAELREWKFLISV